MADWMIWFAVVCVLVILEMATGTFYLLMIAIGVAAGGVAALSDMNGTMQCVIAAIVAAAGTYALRRSKLGRTEHIDAARDPNVNLDIGQALEVGEWRLQPGDGMAAGTTTTATARVMYRGALWDAELAAGGTAVPGLFMIQEVQGNRLVLINTGVARREPGNPAGRPQ
ncbi:MAG TPA: NfeD family protein [Oxalicibacterium sp.]|uniref:NfeD family protein n=1 Tax=Oxalicibacterium sp. TaxID=2766525 RepID=UPI002CCD3D7E|nr:NfeD family protein [Oxalicibacterium sp.]HWU99139.1 NfeD family protein [Oxalicibacterium sp.]